MVVVVTPSGVVDVVVTVVVGIVFYWVLQVLSSTNPVLTI